MICLNIFVFLKDFNQNLPNARLSFSFLCCVFQDLSKAVLSLSICICLVLAISSPTPHTPLGETMSNLAAVKKSIVLVQNICVTKGFQSKPPKCYVFIF